MGMCQCCGFVTMITTLPKVTTTYDCSPISQSFNSSNVACPASVMSSGHDRQSRDVLGGRQQWSGYRVYSCLFTSAITVPMDLAGYAETRAKRCATWIPRNATRPTPEISATIWRDERVSLFFYKNCSQHTRFYFGLRCAGVVQYGLN
jgi:hypothetical protein